MRSGDIDDASLVAAFEKVEVARRGVSLTYFEFGTLAAALLLADAKLDAAVLEVGLGGRLDAVNLFAADCAILTSIALDLLGPEAAAPQGERAARSIGVDDGGALSSQSAVTTFLGARAGTIYAGSSQVQRNIIGERVLGLPKEPRADGGPWSERPGG